MVYLYSSDKAIIKSNTVTMVPWKQSYRTTKPNARGKWYFEFTHIQGANYHLAGFLIDDINARIQLYPVGSTNSISCHLWRYFH